MVLHKYTTKEIVITDYLPGVTGTDDGATIDRLIESVSAYIDSYTKRPKGYFLTVADTVSISARYYAAQTDRMIILPAHHPGTVTIETVPTTAFFESLKGWIYSKDECSIFSPGKMYKINARWGFVETPAEIVEATKQIVARWFSGGRGTFGQITPEGFIIERDAPPSAKALLANFIKNEYEVT